MLDKLTSLLHVFRCHTDIQWWDGTLLRYCAGYVSKYQAAWICLALDVETPVPERALAVLRGWQAAEAEMAIWFWAANQSCLPTSWVRPTGHRACSSHAPPELAEGLGI